MSYPEIFTDGYNAKIVRDPDDAEAPIGISGDGGTNNGTAWLTREEAIEAATSILTAVGAEKPAVQTSGENLNEDLIAVAIAHDRPIRFRYAKGKDGANIELRTLKPEKLTEAGADNHRVVQGFDPDRDDFRMYRLDRIKGKVALG